MNEILSEYPQGFRIEKFVQYETQSAEMPRITVNNGILEIPTFIHAIQHEEAEEGGEEAAAQPEQYAYIPVKVKYRGQTMDYTACLAQCYEDVRRFFYGDPLFQSEMRDDELWEAHSLAVRIAFPRPDGRLVYKYSVYKIQEKLVNLGVWDMAKEYLTEHGLMEKITIIHNVRSDNPYFVEHYPVIKAALEQALPGVDIDEQLRECVMD